MQRKSARWTRRTAAALLLIAVAATTACDRGRKVVPTQGNAAAAPTEQSGVATSDFVWPEDPSEIAVLEIEGLGEIRIGLYGQLAPKGAAHFAALARDGVYDGTLFHRVIPDFMVQGGDPGSIDGKRQHNGQGGMKLKVEDEYSGARHDRGVVSFANRGRPGTAGSQFFIVHQDSHQLDGKYTAFGRVVAGMEVVDAITELEIDSHGRWGPKDHPIEDARISSVRIEGAGNGAGTEVALIE